MKAYKSSNATITTPIGSTRSIDILRGVKQGDVLSALLFCIAIGIITFKALQNNSFGIPIGGKSWSDLSYADDLAVIAKSKAELIKMLENLKKESVDFGLSINFTNTKIMPIGRNSAIVMICDLKSLNVQ